MAALIPEARATRAEAVRLRGESRALKQTIRQNATHSREQLSTAMSTLHRVQAQRDESLPSPWSTLQWTYEDAALAGVLVPVR